MTTLSRKANATQSFLGSLLLLALLLPGAALAAPQGDIAEVEVGATTLIFYPFVEYDKLVLTVTGPCGYDHRRVFDRGETPFFKLEDGITIDGMYTFQLQTRPVIDGEIIEILQQARKNADEETPKELCRQGVMPGDPLVQTSGFTVSEQRIIFNPGSDDGKLGSSDFDLGGEVGDFAQFLDRPKAAGDPAAKDFVIIDDLIVDGSACIGFDCVNGEVFGFDTVRLKENNLRIKFDDTSTAASFPRNDWQLTANDSANGGQSKFSIDDISGSRTPFTVEANARSHSLYVDDGGRIGSRTSTPSVEIHTIDGDTPTLRLQQDGSSGFAPQTWDVAGNETNFFVRDVTNGSTLPFRIRPDAPSSSIFIDVGGDVGMGTSSPDRSLHILGSSGDEGIYIEDTSATNEEHADMLVLEATGGQGFQLIDSSDGGNWVFTQNVNGRFVINSSDGVGNEFLLNGSNGNLTILGTITTSGSCSIGCDRVFTPEYELESIEEHAAYMWENSHLKGVGPTPEGSPMNVTEKTEGILNEVEKAHIYIEQLNAGLKEKDQRIEELSAGLDSKDARITQLEEAVAKLMALVEGQ